MSSNNSKFLLGAILGGVLGGVVALMLAPRTGEETRAMIREEFNNRYGERVDGVKTAMRDRVSVIQDKYGEQMSTLRDKTTQIRDKAKQLSSDLEKRGNQFFGKNSENGNAQQETAETVAPNPTV
jgi:gas vesicle protein